MAFEYEVDVPNEDDDGTTKHTLVFKPHGEVPIGIMRQYRRDLEGQMWAQFEWGLGAEQMKLFDRLPVDKYFIALRDGWSNYEEKADAAKKPAAKKSGAARATDDNQDDEG